VTKSIKNTFLIILTALLVACGVFLLVPKNTFTASAEEVVDNKFSHGLPATNGEFAYTGAAVQLDDLKQGISTLAFKFKIENPKHNDLLKYENDQYDSRRNWWGNILDKTTFMYVFTVHRVNDDGQSKVNVGRYFICFRWHEEYLLKNIYYEPATNGAEEVNIDFSDSYDIKSVGPDLEIHTYLKEKFPSSNASFVDGGYLSQSGGMYTNKDDYSTIITVKARSPYVKYYVVFQSVYRLCSSSNMFATKYNNEKVYSPIASDAHSVKTVLEYLNEYDMVSSKYFSDEALERANYILGNNEKSKVEVLWLKEIDGTPFAELVSQKVDVPMDNGIVLMDDVCAALGVSNLNALGAPTQEFTKVSDGIYKAHYLKSTWLRSMTADGNYQDYFLDINNSYHGYFNQFVQDGIFSKDQFEWYFAQMLNKYPQIKNREPQEVYGAFGMAVLPQTNTLNSFLVSAFDIKTSKVGLVESFSWKNSIKWEAYNKLLKDYDYNWLERAWQGVTGFVAGGEWNAEYYMFYSDNSKAFIGDGGQKGPDDDDGVLKNFWDDLRDGVGEIWGTLTGASGVGIKTIIIIAIAGAIGVAVYRIYKENKK
jgi:hypothetical protein